MPNDIRACLAEKTNMPSYNDIIAKLSETVDRRYPSRNAFANAIGMGASKSKMYKALKGERIPAADAFVAWLDAVGARIVWADDREANTRPVALGIIDGGQTPTVSADHVAIPMGEMPVAAGNGIIPTEGAQRWFIAPKKGLGVRRNLIAAEVGKDMDSMAPTISPGDIVIVDRDDGHTGFTPPGNIFLVRDPYDGLAIKRVTTTQDGSDVSLVFYSDNSVLHPPQRYLLDKDYSGNVRAAIMGRVIYAWSGLASK